jgi:hypothetical protein
VKLRNYPKNNICQLLKMATVKNCNFSCTCNRADCERKHHVDNIEDRAEFKKLYESRFDRKIHNETDPQGVRLVPCYFGAVCGKADCNFKHYCNIEFRKEFSKEWFKVSRKAGKERILAEMKSKYSISDEDLERLSKM